MSEASRRGWWPAASLAVATCVALGVAGCGGSDADAAPDTTVPTTRPILTTTLVTTTTVPPQVYTVQAGDTYGAIAARFGIEVADLLEWNGIDGDTVLHPGDPLLIPAPAAGAEGGTLAAEGEEVPVGTEEYTVEAGDTFGLIAARFEITVEALVQANGLSIDSVVHPGDTLLIPAAVPTSTTTVTPGSTTGG